MKTLALELDVYQGPFDLLLSLVLKEEIDLLEVPLLDIILAYLEQRENEATPDYWEETTEFLLLMSLLAEIKSRLLLPQEEMQGHEELTPEEAREQLLGRLFCYAEFKAAAEYLRTRGMANYGGVLRPPASQRHRRLRSLQEIAGTADVLELRERLSRLLNARQEPDTSHVPQSKVDLRRQIRVVRRILARHGRFSFERFFGGEEPLVQAVSLFALLDLLARGEIQVSQAHAFGDIIVRNTP